LEHEGGPARETKSNKGAYVEKSKTKEREKRMYGRITPADQEDGPSAFFTLKSIKGNESKQRTTRMNTEPREEKERNEADTRGI